MMALIAILSAVGLGAYTQATLKSRDTERKNDLEQMVKAIELFNNDIGRYPMISNGVMTCPQADKTEVSCNGLIYAYLGNTRAIYMEKVPTDPDSGKKYVYVPDTNETGFSLYAALENTQDGDVVVDSNNKPTDWGVSCGSINCNYKITETGLVKTK